MENEARTFVYVLRGARRGQFGYFRGDMASRLQGINQGILKTGVRFRGGDFVMVAISDLREATDMEKIIEERYGKF